MATTRGTAGPPGSSPSQASIPGNAFALCYPLANLDGSGLCAASEVANRNGGRSRARTCDPGLVRAVLFQLSYPPRPMISHSYGDGVRVEDPAVSVSFR